MRSTPLIAIVVALGTCHTELGCATDVRAGDTSQDLAFDVPGCLATHDLVRPSFPSAMFEPAACADTSYPIAAEQVIELVSSDWPHYCDLPYGPLPTTPVLMVQDAIELSVDDFDRPDYCQSQPLSFPCRGPWFRIDPLASPEVLETEDVRGDQRPVRIRLTPGAYRIRPQVRIDHWDGKEAFLDVLPGCLSLCDAGSRYCEWDRSCMPEDTFNDYRFCRACLGGSDSGCSCWTASGPRPDEAMCALGSDCSDVVEIGRCVAGICCSQN